MTPLLLRSMRRNNSSPSARAANSSGGCPGPGGGGQREPSTRPRSAQAAAESATRSEGTPGAGITGDAGAAGVAGVALPERKAARKSNGGGTVPETLSGCHAGVAAPDATGSVDDHGACIEAPAADNGGTGGHGTGVALPDAGAANGRRAARSIREPPPTTPPEHTEPAEAEEDMATGSNLKAKDPCGDTCRPGVPVPPGRGGAAGIQATNGWPPSSNRQVADPAGDTCPTGVPPTLPRGDLASTQAAWGWPPSCTSDGAKLANDPLEDVTPARAIGSRISCADAVDTLGVRSPTLPVRPPPSDPAATADAAPAPLAAWPPAARGGGLARERGAVPPLGAELGAERAEGCCHVGVPPCEATSESPCQATKELPWEARARASKESSTPPRRGAAGGSGGGNGGGSGVRPGAGDTGGFEGTCACTLHKLLALMLSLYWKAGSGGRRSDSSTSVHCRRFEAEDRPWELEPRPDAVVPKLARELVAEPWPRLDLRLARGLSCGPPDDGDAALAPAPAPRQE